MKSVKDATTKARAWPSGDGARLQPSLKVLKGSRTGHVFWLERGDTILGRGEQCTVSLDEEGVSREHAKIVVVDDIIVNLVDLRSTNGTRHNGERIDTAVLRDGDRISLGPDVELRFGYRDPQDTAREPEREPVELSPREFEIASMVAQGLDNVEIGEQLGISRHTVMKHLSNVYRRCGVASRVELATLMALGNVRARR
jgi:DNA-binding CsgD family transcriptional regulator